MEDIFKFADDLGPEKVIHFYDPASRLKGILVVDNVAAGPSIGGTRMAPDVSLEECFRLARAMTLKNAAAGLPHGGGKSVIFADPKMPLDKKERLVRAFAYAIKDVKDYIVGPDMGTDETCMAWVKDVINRSVGLPVEIGGIPLDEIGATGFGLAAAIDVAQDYCDVKIKGARVVIQGFGSVGKHAARFLCEKGAVLIGASDSRGGIVDSGGIDVAALIAHKNTGKDIASFGKGKAIQCADIIGVDCDIWIPAARPDVLTKDNVGKLKTRMVAEGANIPVTLEAERILHERGVMVLPDFIANAGGVICASVEYHGGNQTSAFATIDEKIRANTAAVLKSARATGALPRDAAISLAKERVRRAMTFRQTY
ncbi:MAG: Glu/Leu/Phe/Val dehydrogenase [Rhodospirillales bacterium]